MNIIAVITESDRDYRMHVLQQNVTEKDTKFVQVRNLNSVYGLTINSFVTLTNSIKMPNLNKIKEVLETRIVKPCI